ncbi:hypothetical protein D6D01_02470 [Aureobasidium pullulans]|uniref:ER lumen protein-retaining receptor n=1 Tax=Aureobasidium pullulans TaxID=5580 RepID=A0A4S9LSG6_AURPU|nr:hypothetical protein D6D01_02470 [Aureobasidium pullulans]
MGWKDILRPIRDGLRDNLPSKQPHDNPEKNVRRQQDLLKGFTYFDSFQDLDDWHPDQAYSFQRANTPLLPRSGSTVVKGKSNITLIHDFSGNYHDYENVHGSFVDQPSYSGEYMQSIDTFVYFSHKLICVPPPSWINTLHRNGVKALGTFLVEPQSVGISKILHRSLADNQTWEYALATQLTHIARFYGFDGWLINIEKTFPIADWSLQCLQGFLEQLRSSFGDGCVIWYDSLTCKNTINYQNALTEHNILLAKAAGSILTNYVWSAESAARSKAFALQNGFDPVKILCGIDVWAQSSEGPGRLRETYPKEIGGGTGTGLGVAKLAEVGLGSGLFAPAWPYEHFPSRSDSEAVERSMWTGNPLPETLCCSCTVRDRHAIRNYMTEPILKNAHEFPAGSENFFYTDFKQGFEQFVCASGTAEKNRAVAGLISKSVLPRSVLYAGAQKTLFSCSEVTETNTLLLAEIMQVCIQPRSGKTRRYSISDVALSEVNETWSCLLWKVSTEGLEDAGSEDDGLPHSDVTGPFDFFVINIDGREIGRGYSLDYLLRDIDDEILGLVTAMMNIFRILGDLSHLFSILILLHKMKTSSSASGISFKSQFLYLIVYVTRYIDLLWTDPFKSLWNTTFKLVFIGTSSYIIYLMLNDYKPTHDPNLDTFRVQYLVAGSAVLGILFPYKYIPSEMLWAFSIWLEAVAILPQLFMLQRTGEAETITTHYLFALGAYRALYIPNWIYRWFTEGWFEPISVIAGLVQTVLYSDFFYIYYTKVFQGKKFNLPV